MESDNDDNKINSLTKEAILELVNVFKIKKEKNTINRYKINKKSKKCTKILQNKKSFCSDSQQNLPGQMEQCKDRAMTGRKRRYTL